LISIVLSNTFASVIGSSSSPMSSSRETGEWIISKTRSSCGERSSRSSAHEAGPSRLAIPNATRISSGEVAAVAPSRRNWCVPLLSALKMEPGTTRSSRLYSVTSFAVIRELIGHGVGYELHEEPEIPNFAGSQFKDVVLKEGMTLAIEPMLSAGSAKIKKSKDKYGYLTADDSLSAHYEHTVVVTKNGCEVLTKV